jgi:tetratricopeptide (TPR) repeat protein
MIEAVLRYVVLNSGAASCVLELDADWVEEVVLSTTPLHLTMDGQFINLEAGMPAFTAPSPSTESVVCDPHKQRHVWRGEVADQRLLTIEVKRASVCLGWATAKYERGRFFVSSALQFGIHLQTATRSFAALAERSQPGAAGSLLEGDDWRRVVRAYARARRVEEVLALFTQRVGRYAAGMTQGEVETFRHLGFFLAVQGHLAQALSAFDLVLREQPTNTDVMLARGIVLQEMRQHAAAVRAFRAALALDADCCVGWELLGNALLEAEGDPHAALSAYERATALNPVRASSYHGKGTALSRCGRAAEALAAFEVAVWLDPSEPRYRESLRALQDPHASFEPCGQGPLWERFSEHTWLFCEWLTAFMDELIAQRGSDAPASEGILRLPPATPQLAGGEGRWEEVATLARAFFALWRGHPLRALRSWWVEVQRRRRQAKARSAVQLSLGVHGLHVGVLFCVGLLAIPVSLVLLHYLRGRPRGFPGADEKGRGAWRWHTR